MSEYVGRGLTHKQGILESGKLRGRNFGEKLWGSRACMGLAWWEEDGCELWHKAVCGTTTPGSRLLVCRVTLCTTMQVYSKFGLLGAVSFTLCNMYCSFLHNDVFTMHYACVQFIYALARSPGGGLWRVWWENRRTGDSTLHPCPPAQM